MVDSSSVFLLFLLSVSSVLFKSSMQNITVGLLNINGGRDGQKRSLIAEVAAQKKMDMFFLQGTHTTAADKIDGSVVVRTSLPQP